MTRTNQGEVYHHMFEELRHLFHLTFVFRWSKRSACLLPVRESISAQGFVLDLSTYPVGSDQTVPPYQCCICKCKEARDTSRGHCWDHRGRFEIRQSCAVESSCLEVLQVETDSWSTFAGETQALADGLGHTEWLACHLAELKYPSFSLSKRHEYFKDFGIQAIADCRSIYDHLQAFASPGSISDMRVAIDLVMVKEALTRLWGSIRWAPAWLQLADALTKENADAMDILRGAIESNVYHLNNANVMLQNAAEQHALRARKKEDKSEDLGSEVLYIQDFPIESKMVKIPAKGFAEEEIRALFEIMVSRHVKSSEEFLAHHV